MFVMIMWLTITSTVMSRNVELRQPMRETRGFSRAQTGDGFTAVLPMTWSITMLMHASTHSVNFDENTTGTTFTFTVIAYQWGWNYYFPRDIVDVYWAMPKVVGQGRVDTSSAQPHYDALLDYTRKSIAAKQTNAFRYASKQGKNTAPNALSLYLRTPFTLQDQPLPMLLDSGFMSSYNERALDQVSSRSLTNDMTLASAAWLGELLDECGAAPAAALSENSFAAASTAYASPLAHTHDSLSMFDADSVLASKKANTLGYLGSATGGLDLDQSWNYFNTQSQLREEMMRYRLGDATRTKSSLLVASNRLTLAHQHTAAWLSYISAGAETSRTPSTYSSALLFDNLSRIRESFSFVMRGAVLGDKSALASPSTPSASIDTDLFEQYGVAVSNVGLNVWPLFYNTERYLLNTDASWEAASFELPEVCFNLFSSRAG